MGRSVNKCHFIGNMTSDPKTAYTASGSAVTNISIACNESYKNKAGEQIDNVEFINVVYFGKLAEIVGEYGRIGSPVYVEGSFTTDKYEKDGQTRYSTKIKGRDFNMLSSSNKPDNAGNNQQSNNQQGGQGNQQNNQQGANNNFSGKNDFDDDLDF